MTALTVKNTLATQTLKTVDMEAVRTAVAVLLAGVADNVTTLEVKTLLRDNNYRAFQKDVSRLMHKMADDGILSTIDAGDYCLFSIVEIVAAPIQIN